MNLNDLSFAMFATKDDIEKWRNKEDRLIAKRVRENLRVTKNAVGYSEYFEDLGSRGVRPSGLGLLYNMELVEDDSTIQLAGSDRRRTYTRYSRTYAQYTRYSRASYSRASYSRAAYSRAAYSRAAYSRSAYSRAAYTRTAYTRYDRYDKYAETHTDIGSPNGYLSPNDKYADYNQGSYYRKDSYTRTGYSRAAYIRDSYSREAAYSRAAYSREAAYSRAAYSREAAYQREAYSRYDRVAYTEYAQVSPSYIEYARDYYSRYSRISYSREEPIVNPINMTNTPTVKHTEKWKKNLEEYQKKHTDRTDSYFWAGEKFILNISYDTSESGKYDEGKLIDKVVIKGTNYSQDKFSTPVVNGTIITQTATLWDESMISKWGDGKKHPETFEFTFKDGSKKEVNVIIDSDVNDAYYLFHRGRS